MTSSINEFRRLEKAGAAAVKKIRYKNLTSGIPFMINSSDLPSRMCYLEYPDGSIKVATINNDRTDYEILSTVTISVAAAIRKKRKLEFPLKPYA
ncbi:MAG: hypothetical protein U0V75_03070 [Ferruginibacter sp.]